MGNQGRFGKYGDLKRVERLRKSRVEQPFFLKTKSRPFDHGLGGSKETRSSVRLRFRLAKASNDHFITRLCEKVFSAYGPYHEIISKWRVFETTNTIIAQTGFKPVGFFMLGAICNQYGMKNIQELLAIAVDPEKQGLGIGNALMIEVERRAVGMKSRGLCLHTAVQNKAARNLFMKCGYCPSEIKHLFYPAGQDAVFMSKLFTE